MRRFLAAAIVVAAVTFGGGATHAPAATTSTCPDLQACLDEIASATARAQTFATSSTSTTVAPTTTSSSSSTTTTTVLAAGNVPVGVCGTWHQTFGDQFTALTLDRTKWNTWGSWERNDGGRSNVGNGELDYKTDGANFAFDGNTLTIQARRETAPNGYAWTSGQIGSVQAFTYGYIETRARFASPAGFLNAFWTWGAPGSYGSAQETDAYEFYTDNHTRLYLTSHAGAGGGCQGVTLSFDPTLQMHVYGADIEPGHTDWYIDGQLRCSAAGAPTQAWNIVDYMTVNSCSTTAYGQPSKNRAPCAAASTTHAEKVIDYVRAWSH